MPTQKTKKEIDYLLPTFTVDEYENPFLIPPSPTKEELIPTPKTTKAIVKYNPKNTLNNTKSTKATKSNKVLEGDLIPTPKTTKSTKSTKKQKPKV